MEFSFFEKYYEVLTVEQLKNLEKYYELIAEYNKVMNLTGIDDKHGVYLKHFYDTLSVYDELVKMEVKTIADLGSGMGVPGIVLAIVFPNINFYLIEPLEKRCKFLNIVVEKLNLSNVKVLNVRSENLQQKFDVVVCRAVAKLNILCELSCQLVKVDGTLICLKGLKYEEEISDSERAFKMLNFKLNKLDLFKIPVENSNRANVYLLKTKQTSNKYPRNYSQIKSKPL